MLTTFWDQNTVPQPVNPDASANLDSSEMMTVNAFKKASVLTGIVWRTKLIKNVVTTVWNPLVLFLIPLDVSVILPVSRDVSVTKASSVINMVTVSLLDNVQVSTALIMKFIPITIIHVMKTVALLSMAVLLQLLFNLVACAKKDL